MAMVNTHILQVRFIRVSGKMEYNMERAKKIMKMDQYSKELLCLE